MPISNLDQLLKDMEPAPTEGRYFMASVAESQVMVIANYLNYIVDVFREKEGISIVFSKRYLKT